MFPAPMLPSQRPRARLNLLNLPSLQHQLWAQVEMIALSHSTQEQPTKSPTSQQWQTRVRLLTIIDFASPTSDTDVDQPVPSEVSEYTTSQSVLPADAATTVVISTYTVTLWTTVTSCTTVSPSGPLQSTIVSSPIATTSFPAQLFTSTYKDVTITVPCDEDESLTNERAAEIGARGGV